MWRFGLVCAVILAASIHLYTLVDPAPQTGDARQNLIITYNVLQHGVFSSDRGAEITPGNLREPMPIALMALASVFSNIGNDLETFLQDNYNFIYINIIISISIYFMIYGFITYVDPKAWPASVFAIVAVHWFYVSHGYMLNRALTEIHASALIVALSWATLASIRTMKRRWFAAIGLCLGLLALTKAAFLYVGIGFLLVVAVWCALQRGRLAWRIAISAIVMVLVVAPWMMRNQMHFGSPDIALRAGPVLLIRAYKNQMTAEEWRGAFFIYGPRARWDDFGPILGFNRDDRRPGRPLQRLSRDIKETYADLGISPVEGDTPDMHISFYRRALNEWLETTGAFEGAAAEATADRVIRDKAVDLISGDLKSHIATTPVFLWRGVNAFLGADRLDFVVNMLSVVALFVLAVLSVVRRNAAAFAITLFPIGLILFYGLFSHFIPRYAMPIIPSMLISLALCAYLLRDKEVGHE